MSTAHDPTPEEWFRVEYLGDDTWCIAEPGHANTFLLLGERRALLFDTGTGVRDIGAVVSRLTPLPLVVVNSHAHFDHRGGNRWLTDRAEAFLVHPDGTGHHGAASAGLLRMAREGAAWMAEAFVRQRLTDEMHALPADLTVRPLPEDPRWVIPAVPPTGVLAHDEILDLGGRTLRALHTPGHSPDSLCLLDESTGLLLAGDCVLHSDYFVHLPGADPRRFAASLRMLESLPVRRVGVGHNLHPLARPELITVLREALDEVVAGRAADDTVTGPYGVRTSRHAFPGFHLLLPPQDDRQSATWELWRQGP